MLQKLLTLLKNPEAEVDLGPEEAREAVAAILVETACADDEYTDDERRAIERILKARYALTETEAQALRGEGEEAHKAASDLVRFTQAVKRAVPHEERVGVIEAVWEVAYADGARDHTESAFVRRLCGLLYVSDIDSGLARKRVAARHEG